MSGLDTHTNFNPRSHEGSDRNMGFLFSPYRISIHAPTRGATLLGEESCVAIHRFQSTLPRGERRITGILEMFPQVFQSTLPRGERPCGRRLIWCVGYISIHAPTRGATIIQAESCVAIHRFQSTLPRGERRITGILEMFPQVFQSTLPRGERPCGRRLIWCVGYISIHAPTRGATIIQAESSCNLHISIHAPTRGATFSIHRYKPVIVFQSTLPRGERLIGLLFCHCEDAISIHAPTRGATAIFAKKFSFLSAKIV